MPRIRCYYVDCVFLDDGFCSAAAIELDPDMGCGTFARANDLEVTEELELDELDGWDDLDDLDDEEDLWLDDDY